MTNSTTTSSSSAECPLGASNAAHVLIVGPCPTAETNTLFLFSLTILVSGSSRSKEIGRKIASSRQNKNVE